MESAMHSVQLVELCTEKSFTVSVKPYYLFENCPDTDFDYYEVVNYSKLFDKHFIETESNLKGWSQAVFYSPPRAPAMCWWNKHNAWWFRCTKSAEGKPVDGARGCEAKFWGLREEENVWLTTANVSFVCMCTYAQQVSPPIFGFRPI